MQLYEVIKTYAQTEYDSGNDQAVADVLNAQSEVVIDDTLRDFKFFIENFDDAETVLIYQSLQAVTDPVEKALRDAVNSVGVDLSNTKVRQIFNRIAVSDNWDSAIPGLRTKIGRLGRNPISPAQLILGRDVTAVEISNLRVYEVLLSRLNSNYQAAVAAIEDGTATDYDTDIIPIMSA